MIWALLVAALAAHVSCMDFQFTGVATVTKEDFCTRNTIDAWNCDAMFSFFLTVNPEMVECTDNRPTYSNHCELLPKPTKQPQRSMQCSYGICSTNFQNVPRTRTSYLNNEQTIPNYRSWRIF
uniref:Kazal-like domain-containing protein n=1 Tax=Anopheles farauti TaxID=69004 RepID=A0A1Y9H9J9_9DIPT